MIKAKVINSRVSFFQLSYLSLHSWVNFALFKRSNNIGTRNYRVQKLF